MQSVSSYHTSIAAKETPQIFNHNNGSHELIYKVLLILATCTSADESCQLQPRHLALYFPFFELPEILWWGLSISKRYAYMTVVFWICTDEKRWKEVCLYEYIYHYNIIHSVYCAVYLINICCYNDQFAFFSSWLVVSSKHPKQ